MPAEAAPMDRRPARHTKNLGNLVQRRNGPGCGNDENHAREGPMQQTVRRDADPTRVIVVYGTRLVPPRSPDDCSCLFCSLFRAGHAWRTAVAWLVATAAGIWVTLTVTAYVDAHHNDHRAMIVGGMWLLTSMVIALTLAACRRPIRRWLHRENPRTHAWPPPGA